MWYVNALMQYLQGLIDKNKLKNIMNNPKLLDEYLKKENNEIELNLYISEFLLNHSL